MFDKIWQSYGPWLLEFLQILACLLNSSYILAWNWTKLAGMLHHKCRSACGEIIHVWQILAELWSLALRIFTHFSLSLQLLLHPCMDLNETLQECCTTSLEVHVGRSFMFDKFWQSYGPWHLEFLHILACLLNSSYILAWIWMKLGRSVAPQVQMNMWGDNLCSTNFAGVMTLEMCALQFCCLYEISP